MSQQPKDVGADEGGLSRFARFAKLPPEIRNMIWKAMVTSEVRGVRCARILHPLLHVYMFGRYKPHTCNPVTLQVNQESRSLTKPFYVDIWNGLQARPSIYPSLYFNLQIDSLYIMNEKQMRDTVTGLGANVNLIHSITVPSRILKGINVVKPRDVVPLENYLQEWLSNQNNIFPFHNLTTFIVEDPPCNDPIPSNHRLSQAQYCTSLQQAVEAFFQQENARHRQVSIPQIAVRPQVSGPNRCQLCITRDDSHAPSHM